VDGTGRGTGPAGRRAEDGRAEDGGRGRRAGDGRAGRERPAGEERAGRGRAVDWTGWVGVGLGVAGVVILAWMAATRTPTPAGRRARIPPALAEPAAPDHAEPAAPDLAGPAAPAPAAPSAPGPADPAAGPAGGGWTFEDYRAGWREAHLLEEGAQPGGRVAAAYLRVPYAVGAPLARGGVDPDLVTLAALWLALVAGWTATLGPGWAAAAGILTLLAGVADSVDGAVAVMQGRTSAFGFVWDSTADRLADLALVAGPVILVVTVADPGRAALATAAGGAAAGLLLLLEYVRARAQAGGVAAAWSLATPGERPTRVIVLGLAGLAVGAAQLLGGGPAEAARDAGYPLALAALAVLEAAGCVQLLAAVRRAGGPLR
jgi:phosphatidylglycerophosphate synthase